MIRPLTSLRFFFAFIVFFSHLKFLENTNNPVFKKLHLNLLMDGHLGVSFFFILSGFILVYSYKEKMLQQKTTNKEFWIARFARIYPLHLFTLLLAIPYSLYMVNSTGNDWLVILGSQFTLTQSFFLSNDIFYSLNAPAWSISCEAFFYFMFPFLLLFFSAKRKRLHYGLFFLLVLLIPVSIAFIKGEISYWLFYINPVFRLVDFTMGLLLYEAYKKFNHTISSRIASFLEISFVTLMLVFIAAHNQIGFTYRLSCYYWLPMCLVIFIFSFQKGILSKLLSKKAFIILGEISFAFYLVHMLVIRYVEALNDTYHFSQGHLIPSIMMLVISLTLSYALHKCIEVPLNNRIKAWYKNRKLIHRVVEQKETVVKRERTSLALVKN